MTAMNSGYQPSPVERVREQVALYEVSEGREGATLGGRPVVILTTVGARSGNVRKNPIIRIKEDGRYVAVASNAGASNNPAWYTNVKAHPDVSLQDGRTVHRLRAREVFGDEKDRLWLIADRHWPHFPEYRSSAGRDIPVLLLEPAEEAS